MSKLKCRRLVSMFGSLLLHGIGHLELIFQWHTENTILDYEEHPGTRHASRYLVLDM